MKETIIGTINFHPHRSKTDTSNLIYIPCDNRKCPCNFNNWCTELKTVWINDKGYCKQFEQFVKSIKEKKNK